jgi:hypothetical protein
MLYIVERTTMCKFELAYERTALALNLLSLLCHAGLLFVQLHSAFAANLNG